MPNATLTQDKLRMVDIKKWDINSKVKTFSRMERKYIEQHRYETNKICLNVDGAHENSAF